MSSVQKVAVPSSSAFVIIPFGSVEDAEHWVSEACGGLADEPVVVTPGARRHWTDTCRGVAGIELAFEGGWRAKYAGSGTVVMARCDDSAAKESCRP